MTSTTLDFTDDLITSLNTLAHSFGACESRDSTDQQPLGYACLRVEGADAAVFLQGQMTADVGAQSVGECVVSALCNPKGRVIAPMDIARFSDTLFGLILANHLVDVVKTTLSRYILRSKLTITPWPEQPLVTLTQHTKATTTQDCGLLDDNQFYCRTAWMRDCGANWILTNATSDPSDADTDRDLTWSQAHVLFGIAPPVQATELQHIPQMLNLDALGGVSMTKGCYTGQEIIARVHHKGSVKRRLRRFTAPANVQIALGDPIANAAGSNAGMVVEVATDDHDRTGILAVVKESDFSNDATLTCGNAPLAHWLLPYTV